MAVNYDTGNGSITEANKLASGGIYDVNAVKIDDTNLDTNLVGELVPTFQRKLGQISEDIVNVLNNFKTITGNMKSIESEVKSDKIISPNRSNSSPFTFSLFR